MALINDIKNRVANLLYITARGTFLTPTGQEEYPIAWANELLGGHHGFDNLDELAAVPLDRLQAPMLATVKQHVDGNGDTQKRTTYVLETLPPNKISDIPNYDLSQYWKLLIQGDFEGTLETQYAPDVNGKRPLFQAIEIDPANYQAGYASDADAVAGAPLIWVDEFDATVPHVWQRQRFGANSDWGIPVKIFGEDYQTGDYIDNRFQWVPKGNSIPATPSQIVNGVPNNDPTGWFNTPEVPQGQTYDSYVLNHDLYRITATKDVYGVLKTPWQQPVKISTDPQLVRYGNQPGNTDFFNETFWRPYYTPGIDTHMASRTNTGSSEWTITQIDAEDGEFPAFSYKNFPLGYEPLLSDAPQTAEGLDNGWTDAPTPVGENEVRHVSTTRKFSNGSLKRAWSKPLRFDGLDTIQVVIEPSGEDVFVKSKVDGNTVINPSSIILNAKFYRGSTEITNNVSYEWSIKNGVSFTIIPTLPLGTEPNRNIEILNNGKQLQIFPENVNDIDVFRVRAVFEGEDYFDLITINDFTDIPGFRADIDSTDGFTYKNQTGDKTFSAQLFEDGLEITTGLQKFWSLDGGAEVNSDTIIVSGSDVNNVAVLKVRIVYGETEVFAERDLTDITDGEGLDIQYSRSAVTIPAQIPDNSWFGDVDPSWTDWPTGAIWQRVKKSSEANYGNAIRIKGESGSPNGGFIKDVYRNSVNQPATPSGLISGLLPTGGQWTDQPTTPAAGQFVWRSVRTFLKNPATTSQQQEPSNWTPQNNWSTPIKVSGGTSAGPPGDHGDKGWSPIFAIKTHGSRRVLQIVNWTGGQGSKPSTGSYIGFNGLTTSISSAVDIRGPKGDVDFYRPQEFFRNRSVAYTTGETGISQSQGWRTVGSLTIKNNHTKKRWFEVNASIGVSNDRGADHFAAELSDGTLLVDQDATTTDFTSLSTTYKSKMRLEDHIELSPNQSKTYSVRVRQIGGGAGKREVTAYITGKGL